MAWGLSFTFTLPEMKKNIFEQFPNPRVTGNVFDLSHDVKQTMRMGGLFPSCVMEVLPGDAFRIQPEMLLRFLPLVSPVMHRVKAYTHFFFVPNRILWPGWEAFITGQSEDFPPYLLYNASKGFATGSIFDYLGFPTDDNPTTDIFCNPLPLYAYLKIWDDFYRDQNLQTEKFQPATAGDNDTFLNDYRDSDSWLYRAWEHDYFTSCLPFEQKGDEAVLPLVNLDNVPIDFTPLAGATPIMRNPSTGAAITTDANLRTAGGAGQLFISSANVAYDPEGTLTVDINADAASINSLRRAFKLQEWLEKNARGGTRYIESIMAHFDQRSSDARLQRPEYLGGMVQNVILSEVLTTAQTQVDTQVFPVGNMAGHGISVGTSAGTISFRAEEHGWVLGIVSIMPDTSYQQGFHKSLLRMNYLDYAWPTFATLGEQAVTQKEIYVGADGNPNVTFGFQARYSEYRTIPSRVAGQFKTTLAFWHIGRIFETFPLLNDNFIQCIPRDDIFAVGLDNEDHVLGHIVNKVRCYRKLPAYGIPSI